MRSQVNRTASDVILHAPITGTPSPTSCNRCCRGFKRRGSEPSGKRALFFHAWEAPFFFPKWSIERSELQNSTVYKLRMIGLWNIGLRYAQWVLRTSELGCILRLVIEYLYNQPYLVYSYSTFLTSAFVGSFLSFFLSLLLSSFIPFLCPFSSFILSALFPHYIYSNDQNIPHFYGTGISFFFTKRHLIQYLVRFIHFTF